MLTDLDKEIVDKVEQAIRLGFQIAQDSATAYRERGDGWGDYYRINWSGSKKTLEKRIQEMRNAALGQETEAA